MEKEKQIELTKKWLAGTATDLELKELHDWYDQWKDEEEQVADSDGKREEIRAKIWVDIQERMHKSKRTLVQKSFIHLYGKRIAAAAVLILMISSYFLFFHQADVESPPIAYNIKAPDINRATILLADGQHVYLDSANSGQLAMQKGMKILKLDDGKIEYKGSSSEAVYNTLTNPRGSKVATLTLADGSRVWLNAASDITFPTAFIGKERRVEIKGEAYFEVAENASMPFIVKINNKAEVKVLGTHFNINAYEDEGTIKTTLLEGSVQVSSLIAHHSLLITPDHQASLDASGKLSVEKVDAEEAIAWKEGMFHFNDTNIETIMNSLARWYNLKVQYEGNVKTLRFGGIISRKENASAILGLMKRTGTVDFDIQGTTLIVKAGKDTQ